jgi:teichuronic acid exporter
VSNLSTNATRGMLWSLGENFGLQGIQLVVSIVLARLLLPANFGLIGILALFIALAQSIPDSGFGSALIQKKDVVHHDTCSVFYFNLSVGLLLTALLWGAAPLFGRFFNEPLLTPLTRFLSLNVIISAIGLVPSALLTKRLDFKVLFRVSLVSAGISGAVGVSMALRGMGVWSLAVQSVLSTLLRATLMFRASGWRPTWDFNRSSLANMFPFGSRMWLSGLLDITFQNIYQPLIGRLYSATSVGYYGRAQTLQDAAVQPAGSALYRVLFPVLVPIQGNRTRLKQAIHKIMTTTVFFHFPLMIGLLAAADPLVRLLLTDRWAPSIPYFQLFCVMGLFFPLSVINVTILIVTGRSDQLFRLEVIKRLISLAAIAITFRWGISALLWGQIASAIAGYLLNSHFCGRPIGYPVLQQMRDFLPFLLMALLMGAGMYWVGTTISSSLPKLLAQLLLGIAIYFAVNLVLGRSTLAEVLRLARQVIGSRQV